MKFIFVVFISFLMSYSAFAKDSKKAGEMKELGASREKLIGTIIKQALETYHYRNMKINDDVSRKAFKEFIKRVDYSKQFLLKKQVKELENFQFQLDDQMISGDHKLLNKTIEFLDERIKKADELREKFFKEQFDFTKNESIQLDPEKRDFAKDEKEWEEMWRKVFKHATLNRYLALVEGQKETPKKDKEKDKEKEKKKEEKKEKKLTDKEMRKKAHEAVSKKYANHFKRMQKEDRYDHLEKFFNAIANIFDPHTTYLPPKRKEDFDIDISGSLEGIGAVLQEDGPHIKVVKIVPGGAAWRQKELEVDDLILFVGEGDKDPVDLVDMRVDDAVRYIRGPKGTEVRLTVKKADGTRKVIPIIRDVVQIGASFAKSSILEMKGLGLKIGYILVPKFYRDFGNIERNCTDDVRMELDRLKKQNVDGVILDLRNNGGGALEDARQMSGLFIKQGPIVQIKSHTKQIEVLADDDPGITFDKPLIVMLNRFSASASEILAGAMQDYKRAVIVGGEYSHGKGTVQAVLNLNQGPLRSLFGPTMGALKVTIQKFYRITGVSTQYKGVTPDIILPDPLAYAENREQDLDYSLPWDTVKAKRFQRWSKHSYNMSVLRRRSKTRVSNNRRFQKINQSVDYLIKRREDTLVSLNKDTVLEEEERNKKITEKLKMEELNTDLLVTNYEPSLKSHEQIRPGEEKKWKEDFELRKEEWVKGLRQDPGLEESIYIMDDMIRQVKGKKLSMVK